MVGPYKEQYIGLEDIWFDLAGLLSSKHIVVDDLQGNCIKDIHTCVGTHTYPMQILANILSKMFGKLVNVKNKRLGPHVKF